MDRLAPRPLGSNLKGHLPGKGSKIVLGSAHLKIKGLLVHRAQVSVGPLWL